MRSSCSCAARVHVDGKARAVAQRPGELRIDVEIEHAAVHAVGDLVGGETVEAIEPVGLIEPVLALQRRGFQRQQASSNPGSGENAA